MHCTQHNPQILNRVASSKDVAVAYCSLQHVSTALASTLCLHAEFLKLATGKSHSAQGSVSLNVQQRSVVGKGRQTARCAIRHPVPLSFPCFQGCILHSIRRRTMGGSAQRAMVATSASWEIVICVRGEKVSCSVTGSHIGASLHEERERTIRGELALCLPAGVNIQNSGALVYMVRVCCAVSFSAACYVLIYCGVLGGRSRSGVVCGKSSAVRRHDDDGRVRRSLLCTFSVIFRSHSRLCLITQCIQQVHELRSNLWSSWRL
jgi:hypothetical protein